MKIKLLLLTVLLPAALTAQVKALKGYTLRGHLINASNKMAYLTDLSKAPRHTDSTFTDANGRFMFKGVVAEPGAFNLQFKHGIGSVVFYVENADILLEGDADSLASIRIKGSKEDLVRQEFQRIVAAAKNNPMEDHAYREAVASRDTLAIAWEKARLEAKDRNNILKSAAFIVNKYPNSTMAVALVATVMAMQKTQLADSLLKLVEQTPAARLASAKLIRKTLSAALSLTGGAVRKTALVRRTKSLPPL